MYTRRGRARAGPPPAPPGGWSPPASSPAARGMRSFGSGGVGTSSEASCSTQPLDPRRVGLLVDAVDGGHPPALAELGDLLVGEDHQVLDQPVGLGLRDGVGRATTAPSSSNSNSGSNDSTSSDPTGRRAASAAAARRARPERLGDLGGRPRAPGEDLVELVVVEARVGADPAAIEARRPRLALAAEHDLGRHGEALDPGRQAARIVAERPRKHRLDRARDVGAGAAAKGLGLERASRPDVGGRRRRCGSRAGRRPPRPRPTPRRRSRARSPGRR